MASDYCGELNVESCVEVNKEEFLETFRFFYEEGIRENRYFFFVGNFSNSDFFNYSVPFDAIQLSDDCLEIQEGKFYFILWWGSIRKFEQERTDPIFYLYMKNDKETDFRFVIEFNDA